MAKSINFIEPRLALLITVFSGLLFFANTNDLLSFIICGTIFLISSIFTIIKMLTSWVWTKSIIILSVSYSVLLITAIIFSSVIIFIFILAFLLFIGISN